MAESLLVGRNFVSDICKLNKLCGRPPQYAPSPVTLTFDLYDLELMSDRVTLCDTGYLEPILVFLGLSVLDLGPTDTETDRRQTASLMGAGA